MSGSHSHPFGKPINVLKFGEGNKVIVDNEELKKMFLHQDVKNRKVVVFSIIGAFRKGKSFFLDYCLRFLYANVSCELLIKGNKSLRSDSYSSLVSIDQQSK